MPKNFYMVDFQPSYHAERLIHPTAPALCQ